MAGDGRGQHRTRVTGINFALVTEMLLPGSVLNCARGFIGAFAAGVQSAACHRTPLRLSRLARSDLPHTTAAFATGTQRVASRKARLHLTRFPTQRLPTGQPLLSKAAVRSAAGETQPGNLVTATVP